jgi:predicted transcriptional regulator
MRRNLNSIILTRQELEIMKAIWELSETKVADVWKLIFPKKHIAYTTVHTLMSILEEKGALKHKRAGRTFIYEPLLSRGQATRNQMQDFVTRYFDGDLEKMVDYAIASVLGKPEQCEATLNSIKLKNEHQVA